MSRIEFQRRLGARLRAIRQQQGLTLQQVEERSGGRWKAVVVGSYERGDRAISVGKLAELAAFYGVPITELLPEPAEEPPAEVREQVVIDLTRLERLPEEEPSYRPLQRYVTSIQIQRGDYNGRMLSLRRDDIRALAIMLGCEPEELLDDLTRRGLVRQTVAI